MFSYEEFKGAGRVGRIDAIKEVGANIEVVYRLYTCLPAIPMYDKQTYRRFGFHHPLECYRTHWAVKGGDLFGIVDEVCEEMGTFTDVDVGEDIMDRLWGT